MSFRNAHIGFLAIVVTMGLGWLLFGLRPSDTEAQIIFTVAAVIGFAVLTALDYREDLRLRKR